MMPFRRSRRSRASKGGNGDGDGSSTIAHLTRRLLFLLHLLLVQVLLLIVLVMLIPTGADAQPTTTTAASAASYAAAAEGSSSFVSSVNVVAVGVAPAGGQRVVVDCRLASEHASESLNRYCEGVPLPEADEEKRWREVPACGRDAARSTPTVALDGQGRAWTREPSTGRLCAFRDELTGLPLPASAVMSAGARQGQQPGEWEAAPECGGDPRTEFVTRDYEGRAWGWQQGASCAWRSLKKEGGR